jgi:hypothetical protein
MSERRRVASAIAAVRAGFHQRQPRRVTAVPIMNFSQLLHQRDALLRQARLANLAYAHERLTDYAHRVERAGLGGALALRPADPAAERPWPMLETLTCAASVLEEHFLEEDAVELEQILTFLRAEGFEFGDTISLSDILGHWLPFLRRELQRGGVQGIDQQGRRSP